MKGLKSCRNVMERLKDEFTLAQLKYAILIECGADDRTIAKYIKLLGEDLKWIKPTGIEKFKKLVKR